MPNPIVDKFNHIVGHKGFDYDQIDEYTFIGTNMCCQFGFNKELLSKEVRADISLEEERVDAPDGVDFFLWLPTKDHQAPSKDKIALGILALDFFKKRNIKVYIHCKNGHGRSSTLFIAYLMKTQKMTYEEAFNFLKSKRPSIHLTRDQINVLKNP